MNENGLSHELQTPNSVVESAAMRKVTIKIRQFVNLAHWTISEDKRIHG